MMEKDHRKSNLNSAKNGQKCVKMTKKGEIRACPKIVAQPAVTSEKGVVFNAVRSSSGVLPRIS